MLKDPICRHCKYKRFTCPIFRCDVYIEAKMKQKARFYYQYFPIEDFDGEDRYVAGLMFKWAIIGMIVLFGIYSIIKVIGEWMA